MQEKIRNIKTLFMTLFIALSVALVLLPVAHGNDQIAQALVSLKQYANQEARANSWFEVLSLPDDATLQDVSLRYRALLAALNPYTSAQTDPFDVSAIRKRTKELNLLDMASRGAMRLGRTSQPMTLSEVKLRIRGVDFTGVTPVKVLDTERSLDPSLPLVNFKGGHLALTNILKEPDHNFARHADLSLIGAALTLFRTKLEKNLNLEFKTYFQRTFPSLLPKLTDTDVPVFEEHKKKYSIIASHYRKSLDFVVDQGIAQIGRWLQYRRDFKLRSYIEISQFASSESIFLGPERTLWMGTTYEGLMNTVVDFFDFYQTGLRDSSLLSSDMAPPVATIDALILEALTPQAHDSAVVVSFLADQLLWYCASARASQGPEALNRRFNLINSIYSKLQDEQRVPYMTRIASQETFYRTLSLETHFTGLDTTSLSVNDPISEINLHSAESGARLYLKQSAKNSIAALFVDFFTTVIQDTKEQEFLLLASVNSVGWAASVANNATKESLRTMAQATPNHLNFLLQYLLELEPYPELSHRSASKLAFAKSVAELALHVLVAAPEADISKPLIHFLDEPWSRLDKYSIGTDGETVLWVRSLFGQLFEHRPELRQIIEDQMRSQLFYTGTNSLTVAAIFELALSASEMGMAAKPKGYGTPIEFIDFHLGRALIKSYGFKAQLSEFIALTDSKWSQIPTAQATISEHLDKQNIFTVFLAHNPTLDEVKAYIGACSLGQQKSFWEQVKTHFPPDDFKQWVAAQLISETGSEHIKSLFPTLSWWKAVDLPTPTPSEVNPLDQQTNSQLDSTQQLEIGKRALKQNKKIQLSQLCLKAMQPWTWIKK